MTTAIIIKAKVYGNYRRCELLATGRDRKTGEALVRVRVLYADLPWGCTSECWIPYDQVRKADRPTVETFRANRRKSP